MKTTLEGRLFVIGMWWRIGYGSLRILLGLAVLKIAGTPLVDVVEKIMSYELIEDPHDILFTFVNQTLVAHPIYLSHFLATYLLFWGTTEVVLSYNLIKDRLWAFPVSLILISAFIGYEILRFTHTHSLILLWIIFLDAIILWLIWKEYERLLKKQRAAVIAEN